MILEAKEIQEEQTVNAMNGDDFVSTDTLVRSEVFLTYRFLYLSSLICSQTSPGFYVSGVQVIWKHGGKKRNCS